MTRTGARGDRGATMLELSITMLLISLLSVIGISSWSQYDRTAQQRATADALVQTMRTAASRAQSDGIRWCVRISSSTTWQLWSGDCGTGTQKGPDSKPSKSKLTLEAVGGVSDVTFRPRGTATAARIKVKQTDRSEQWIVDVEGLTARVSLSH